VLSTVVSRRYVGVAGLGVLVAGLIFSAAASAAAPETPVTKPATVVTATTATLNGELNPKVAAKTGYEFTYNTSGNCTEGTTTTPGSEATGTKMKVSTPATGLEPSKEYTFCMVAMHEAESMSGGALKFKTLGVKPTVVSQSAAAVTPFEATLEAKVNPNNQATTYLFEYAQSNPSPRAPSQSRPGSRRPGPSPSRRSSSKNSQPANRTKLQARAPGRRPRRKSLEGSNGVQQQAKEAEAQLSPPGKTEVPVTCFRRHGAPRSRTDTPGAAVPFAFQEEITS